jgi:predicted SAM-dependent methyltransferase
MQKLNFGCGSIQPNGWTNFDEDPEFKANPELWLHLAKNPEIEYDIIVAHCSLQMNNFKDIPGLLQTLSYMLKKDGVIRISLPDINKGFEAYKEGNIGFFPNGEEDIHIRFCAWLTWYSTTKTLLTQQALYKLLKEAGFRDIVETKFRHSELSTEEITELDTREGECYFLEARK